MPAENGEKSFSEGSESLSANDTQIDRITGATGRTTMNLDDMFAQQANRNSGFFGQDVQQNEENSVILERKEKVIDEEEKCEHNHQPNPTGSDKQSLPDASH